MKKILCMLILVPLVSSCHNWDSAVQLYFAAGSGDEDMVQTILDQGVDANSKTPRGFTALQAAITNNDLAMAKLLKRRGANISMKFSEEGCAPLHVAAAGGHEEIVRYLLEQGADIDATTNEGLTPLIKAVNGNHPNVVQLLLTWQIASELDPGLQALLPEDMVGADIERADDQGATALHHAVEEENIEIASMLIQYTAAVNCSDKQNNTPLHIAAADGNLNMVKLLKENGALVDMQNTQGETPLMRAVLGHKACVAHVEECQCAPDYGNIFVVKYLLDNGADPNIAFDEKSPLNIAAEDNNFEIAYLLIRAGADVDHVDDTVRTPLHNAADRGHLEIIQLLLKAGADMFSTDSNGKTPFDLALAQGHEEIAREFVIHGFEDVGQQIADAEELQRIIPQAVNEVLEEHAVPVELQKMVLSYLSPTVWQSAEDR